MPGAPLRERAHLGDAANRRDRFGRLLGVLLLVFVVSGFPQSTASRLLSSAVYLLAIGVAVGATGLPDRLPRPVVAGVLSALTVASVVLTGQDSLRLRAFGSLCIAAVMSSCLLAS